MSARIKAAIIVALIAAAAITWVTTPPTHQDRGRWPLSLYSKVG